MHARTSCRPFFSAARPHLQGGHAAVGKGDPRGCDGGRKVEGRVLGVDTSREDDGHEAGELEDPHDAVAIGLIRAWGRARVCNNGSRFWQLEDGSRETVCTMLPGAPPIIS